MSKQATKNVASRISAKISSPMILDQYEYTNKGPIALIKNAFKNRIVLNQTESQFLDFKRKQFPLFAKDRYFEFADAYRRKDKVDLIRYLSQPLYDIVKGCIKDGNELPFKIYPEISDVSLVMARMCAGKNFGSTSSATWHQMTLKFVFIDPTNNKDVVKYNVFERRESDASEKDWRICKLE